MDDLAWEEAIERVVSISRLFKPDYLSVIAA
jgi:hypothetical protein